MRAIFSIFYGGGNLKYRSLAVGPCSERPSFQAPPSFVSHHFEPRSRASSVSKSLTGRWNALQFRRLRDALIQRFGSGAGSWASLSFCSGDKGSESALEHWVCAQRMEWAHAKLHCSLRKTSSWSSWTKNRLWICHEVILHSISILRIKLDTTLHHLDPSPIATYDDATHLQHVRAAPGSGGGISTSPPVLTPERRDVPGRRSRTRVGRLPVETAHHRHSVRRMADCNHTRQSSSITRMYRLYDWRLSCRASWW